MAENSTDELSAKRSDFFCGVVEGFYGRPWTTEQRKDLFKKMKKWNMDMYVYAPKDDYKHRAYWREMYTVEEAEHLTSLIAGAKDQGITFCYALSPGLDITYSSQKEITILKRKLEQVSQFGCTCFALLFDDIEPEMSESDKQIFQSFAHAQVSVTNEVSGALNAARLLLCPTQYCAARAVPAVHNSEYLNTLGSKLAPDIDIMWTGEKVISKTLTAESIEEITQVLRRKPVIWDNLHANDYDQKRIYLGPYCGRSPELIPLLKGVLTNPNCEYNANLVAIRTLAHWAECSHDAPTHIDSVSWDIKLEREGEQGVCEDEPPLAVHKHVYHPRQAMRQAIEEWLPEFSIPKAAHGPVIKPQPTIILPPVPIIPIMPSVNTCMSLAAPTPTTTTAIPTLHAAQLQALADVCQDSTPIVSATEAMNPVPNPVMNSLVSPTKVILNESIPNPIVPHTNIPQEIPVSTLPIPILGLKALEENMRENEGLNESVDASFDMKKDHDIVDDEKMVRNGEMSVGDTPPTLSPRAGPPSPLDEDPAASTDSDVVMNDAASENGSMQVEPSHSPLSTDMMVEPPEPAEAADEPPEETPEQSSLTTDDLLLLCELFYLPFAHGGRGLRLLHDYRWLAAHAQPASARDTETCEWRRRRARFQWWVSRARRLSRRLAAALNRELYTELQPYVWELAATLALLDGFVRWLELGKFPANMQSNFQPTYTWFSKGWRETFESGAQEPWVFRGGLTADLRRLLPVESAGEVARLIVPDALPLTVRPYTLNDEAQVCSICHKTCRDGSDCSELFPSDLQTLPADRLVVPFLTLTPEFCMVIEDDGDDPTPGDPDRDPDLRKVTTPEIVGYACAALSSKEFYKKQEIAWIPEMCRKYPAELEHRADLSPAAKDCIRHFHNFTTSERAPDSITSAYPALLTCCVLQHCREPRAVPRLATTLLAALRACGAQGVHVCINATDHHLHQFYLKLGFSELPAAGSRRYLGRAL